MNIQPSGPILVFGHSHMVAMEAAFLRRVKDGSRPADAMKFFHLRRPDKLECEGAGPDRRPVASFRARVEAFIGSCNASAAFLIAGGNEHNALSLFSRPGNAHRAPDFELNSPDGGLDPACERIPFDLYRQELRTRLEIESFPFIRWVVSVLDCPVTVIGPPPPITEEERLQRLKISPARFRHKTWLLDIALRRKLAADIGADFIAPPDRVLDGFGLAPRYRAQDPVHGNIRYGDVMLSSILENAAAQPQESSS